LYSLGLIGQRQLITFVSAKPILIIWIHLNGTEPSFVVHFNKNPNSYITVSKS